MEPIDIAILIVCVCLIAYILFDKSHTCRYEVDGIVVNVLGDFSNADEAKKLMLAVNRRIFAILRHLRVQYYIGATDEECGIKCREKLVADSDRVAVVKSLLRGFNYEVIYENRPHFNGTGDDTAYSVSKGKKIMLCLRNNKLPLKLIDIDTLVFVLLHECAHIAAFDVWGHPERFWSIFKFLLFESEAAGAYKPCDYRRFPVNYCGFHLQSNPYFDDSIIII